MSEQERARWAFVIFIAGWAPEARWVVGFYNGYVASHCDGATACVMACRETAKEAQS